MKEIWKPILGFEGFYEVSNLGRIRSVDRVVTYSNGQKHLHKGCLLKPGVIQNNYLQVALCKDGVTKHFMVHRLVAETFLLNQDNLPQINHKDENPLNNIADNLEWCSSSYNINYGSRKDKVIKTKIKNGYVKPERVGLSKDDYYRVRGKDPEYRKRHNEYNRRYRQKMKNLS